MRITRFLLSLGLGALFLIPSAAQQPAQSTQPQPLQQSSPVVKQAVHHDVSPPLFLIPPAPRQPGLRIHDIDPIPRRYQPAAVDPVLQPSYPTTLAPVTTLNFDGIGNGFTGPSGTFTVQAAPPDTEGDVGPNHYVQLVNTDFAIFNKSGTPIFGPVPINTLWQGFGGLCATDNDGDPVVSYDAIADRWVISQFAVTGANGTSVPYLQCVAVSQTADPTGAYYRYSFAYNAFNDYPKMGVWPDAYYTTFNFFGTTFQGGEVCAYDRTSMLAGLPATQQCFNVGVSYGCLLPADLDGKQLPPAGSPNYVLALGVSNNDLALWKFHVDWATPANTTLTGPITLTVATYTAACSGGTCIPQAGTSQLLDSLADRLMYRLAYRNFGSYESLVANHSVSAGSGGGVRWYEIRSPGTTPTVFQQGTYAPDSNFRWMGSMAMDQNGNMALGFSLSGSPLYPEIHYTGRLVGDPLGQMTQGEGTIIDGAGSQTANLNRWGDYSMMGIDPSDDCTFWYTNEYIPSNGTFNWKTRIGSFKFPNCGIPPPPDFSLSTTPSSVTVTAGSPASYTENITATGGFAGSVSLSITGLPAGASGTFNPNPATGASSALTVTTSSTTPAGSYLFTVIGTSTSPALTHTSTATLVVQSPPPPPPIAFVRAANNLIPVAGTSVSVANMINNASDMLVVACRESAQIAITSVTDTAGNSYAKIANALSTGRESALFFAANVRASSANTISCNFASSTGREAIVVEEFSGVVALDGSVTASANSATTSLPSGNLATTNANDLLIYEVNVGADSTFTAGPGYTIPAGGSNARLAMQFTTVASQGTYSTLESWSTAALADGIFAALKGASSGSAPPSITSLNPTSGPAGTLVTITGANFGATQGTSAVRFSGGIIATPTSWSATSISVPVPAAAPIGNDLVDVVVGGVGSNQVVFTVPSLSPFISNLTPPTGPLGTSVTITGTNFGATQGSSTVTFNGTAATPTSWSATSIVVPVPASATSGNVVVTVGGSATNGVNFTVIPPSPSITSLSPASGPLGSVVTITGANFGASQGTSTATFNGASATPTSWGATTIIVLVPNGATTGNVVVTVAGQASNGANFTVTPPVPNISGLNPTSGPVGTSVIITGANFGGPLATSTVTFNGTVATPTSWLNTTIVAPVPSGATTGNVLVTVGGVASNGVNFTVTTTVPSITSLTPNNGPVGTSVTISGVNFTGSQGTSTVTFNGISAGTAVFWSTTSITVLVPSGATTGNVVVNLGGVASNGVNFTVLPPSITSLSPNSGPGGTPVTITGANFGTTQGTSTVTFNGTTATPTSWSATSIVAPVPTGATNGNVVVTVGGLASNGVYFAPNPPNISALNPNSGPAGITVTITGTNFGASQGTGTVRFGRVPAAAMSWTPTTILVSVPSGAPIGNDLVDVVVGGVGSNQVVFTVTPPPNITSLSPTSGPVGTSVTITGSNFGATQGSSGVGFTGGASGVVTSWSATNIVVTVPSVAVSGADATTGPVVVYVGGVASNGITFTVTPSVSSLNPTSGPIGTSVTIYGGGFGAPQGTSTVTFNGVPATPTLWLRDIITVPVPIGASTGNVVVTVGGVSSNGALFPVIPTIASLSPSSGVAGTAVTITGGGFGPSLGSSTVTFNGTPSTPTSWNSTSIVVPVPSGATTGNVVVTVGGAASAGTNFTVSPSISGLNPTSGAFGSSVTITGSNFGATQGSSSVTFNGVAATPSTWTATSIVVPVPNGSTTGNVVVTVGGFASNGVAFSVTSPGPSITSLNPNFGAVGAPVSIGGTNFGTTQGTSTLTFNGIVATPSSWSATSIAVPVPAGSTTGNVVATVGGIASNGVAFTVLPTPSITNITPPSGPVGTSVLITGTNFGNTQWTSTVTFNGSASTPSSWSPTIIVAPVPTGATTGNIVVTVNGGPSNGVTFTVTNPPPSITNLNPTSGPVGTPVTITGSNFGATQGASFVHFGSLGVAVPTSWSDALIVVPVPAGATTGSVGVIVGGVASNALSFTVTPPPDFSLSTTPSSVTVTAGSPASYTENITATGGFAGSVSLSITGLPAGASGTFNPNPATGASSSLTVTTSSTTPAGSYVFTVTGTSPALTHTSMATLVVQSALPPPPTAFVRAANNLIPVAGTSVGVANMINNASDMLVVACRESAQIAITSVTDTAGNSYAKIANALSTGRESALFFAANIKASSANTISCNFASSTGREAIVVEEFSGVVALDGNVTASTNSATTSLPSGNLATTNANDLLVYEVNVGADSTFTAGPGYMIPAGGSNARLAMQFTTVSSTGTYSTLESWSTAALADGIFAALK